MCRYDEELKLAGREDEKLLYAPYSGPKFSWVITFPVRPSFVLQIGAAEFISSMQITRSLVDNIAALPLPFGASEKA